MTKSRVEGEENDIGVEIGVAKDRVIIRFDRAISWFGMDADSTTAFANYLLSRAEEAKKLIETESPPNVN